MRPFFIAEVSSNHHCDLDRCFAFIDSAVDIGCQAVKFQLFKIDQLFAPEILACSEEHRNRRDWELPVGFLPRLSQRCRERGIQFCCTPFYLEAVNELEAYIDFYKIASYELLWDDLLVACAKTGKPIVLSTGMATMDEITHAVQLLRSSGVSDLTLLHCVSGYPAPIDQCNLGAIETLANQFNCMVGWSDHSVSPAVITRAVHRWKASMVEFHLDLDGAGGEFATGHCWLPGPMKILIAEIRSSYLADGTGEKIPTQAELPDRDWRADSIDGLRPFRKVRRSWKG